MRSNGIKNEAPAAALSAGESAPAAPETGRKTPGATASTDENFHKAIGGIPFVGSTLVFIVKKWGLPGLMLFLAGGAFALGLVYFGVLPAGVVSEKYRAAAGASTPDAAQEGIAPKGQLPLEIAQAESGWLYALVDLYRREGLDAQEAEPGNRSSVDAVEHTVREATKPFAWKLSAQGGFETTAVAFRLTRDGATGAELIEPLKHEGDTRSSEFSVPACRKGDRLIAVVRVWSRAVPPPADVRLALWSGAK